MIKDGGMRAYAADHTAPKTFDWDDSQQKYVAGSTFYWSDEQQQYRPCLACARGSVVNTGLSLQ